MEKWRELVVEGMGGVSGWADAAGGGRGAELLAAPVATGRGPGVLVFLLRASLSLSFAAISSLRRLTSSSCLWSRRLMSALSARYVARVSRAALELMAARSACQASRLRARESSLVSPRALRSAGPSPSSSRFLFSPLCHDPSRLPAREEIPGIEGAVGAGVVWGRGAASGASRTGVGAGAGRGAGAAAASDVSAASSSCSSSSIAHRKLLSRTELPGLPKFLYRFSSHTLRVISMVLYSILPVGAGEGDRLEVGLADSGSIPTPTSDILLVRILICTVFSPELTASEAGEAASLTHCS